MSAFQKRCIIRDLFSDTMKTKVLRKMGYEGTYIYVLQYEFTFQYLFAWENEVFRQEITIKPDWHSWRRWAWWFGYLEHPYTQDQLEQGGEVIISGAMSSIDALKADKKQYKRREAERKARVKVDSSCMWQARANSAGEPIYLCITHNKTAPMEEHKNPKHN